MATSNKYRYWGNWGLPIRGVMGRLTLAQIMTIGAVKATVAVRRWLATVAVRRWLGEVKRLGD
jgi:hypothetical protein